VAFVRFTITCSYYEFQLQFGIPKDSKNILYPPPADKVHYKNG